MHELVCMTVYFICVCMYVYMHAYSIIVCIMCVCTEWNMRQNFWSENFNKDVDLTLKFLASIRI